MEVEWIILAEAAEVLNNKLYLLGGGWENLAINSDFPVHYRCAVAVAIKVPWNETNQRHDVEVAINDEKGADLVKVGAQIEVGRPPGMPRGQAQRVQMAIDLELHLHRAGPYAVITRIAGQEARRAAFNVIGGPGVS